MVLGGLNAILLFFYSKKMTDSFMEMLISYNDLLVN